MKANNFDQQFVEFIQINSRCEFACELPLYFRMECVKCVLKVQQQPAKRIDIYDRSRYCLHRSLS